MVQGRPRRDRPPFRGAIAISLVDQHLHGSPAPRRLTPTRLAERGCLNFLVDVGPCPSRRALDEEKEATKTVGNQGI